MTFRERLLNQQPGILLLILLVSTDIAFLGLFALLAIGVVSDTQFILTYDRSYAEVFQYIKLFWLALMLGFIFLQNKNLLYLFLSVLFGLLLLDDYGSFHEVWGEQLGNWLNLKPMFMLQPYDFGELIVFLSYAVITGPMLWIGYCAADKSSKKYMWEVLMLLVALGFFAVGVDVLHALSLPELISNAIGALEDGGEMVVVSALVWRTFEHSLDSPSEVA